MAIAQKEFDVATLPVTIVTVFSDRAEVKRLLKTEVAKGTNEIIVKKLTSFIDKDSIRVDGRGKASIADVLYQEKAAKKEERSFDQKLESLQAQQKRLGQEHQRLSKLRQTLDDLAGCVGRPSGKDDKKQSEPLRSMPPITKEHLEGLDNFQEYYTSRTTKLDEQIMEVTKKQRDLDEDIRILRDANQEHQHSGKDKYRSVSVILEAEATGAIELDVSYMVSNASWKPSYDLRLYATDRNLKVFYYGLVQQRTGEAWNDVKLLLSTATPSIGGRIPEVGTLQASISRPEPAVMPMQLKLTSEKPKILKRMAKKLKPKSESESEEKDSPKAMAVYTSAALKMSVPEVKVQKSVASMTFEIARPTTIPSDDADHKVTIAIIDLKPEFEHETVPSKEQLAFMKARVVNTSPYPLLSGPSSVYWDNCFVAKSTLKSVSPQESFSCSLGPDTAVRIEQKPVKKFLDDSGFWRSVMVQEQKTVIKNTRTDPILITVIGQIPRSTEEKIKVEVLEPQLSKLIRLNAENNLELKVRANAGETKEVTVRYKVEFPKGEKVVFEEVGP